MKFKKITGVITLGSSLAVVMAVVSCSATAPNKNVARDGAKNGDGIRGSNVSSTKEKPKDDIVYSDIPNEIDKDFGKENFSFPEVTLNNVNNKSENTVRYRTGQPFALHFHARDLVEWDPAKDVDGGFAKSTIPLAKREFADKIIDDQTEKNLDILSGLNALASNTPDGTVSIDEKRSRIFTMWPNIDEIVSWGGAASEATFVIPKGDDTNAAHKNGVPILGTMFFPPNVFGGNEEFYKNLVVEKNGDFPVADNMVKMAKIYGFDGWFLNLETDIQDSDIKSKMSSFISYLYKKISENSLHLDLYEWGQGAQYLSEGNFDKGMIDFQHRNNYDNSHFADDYKLGDKASFGYDFERAGYTGVDEGGKFGLITDQLDKNNWIYGYNKTVDSSINDEKDLEFFSSSQGKRDPRVIDSDPFVEMSKKFNERTVIIGRKAFTTNFSLGFGKDFYVEGEKVTLAGNLINGYRASSIQDVLPTWRYLIDLRDSQNNIVSEDDNFDAFIDSGSAKYWGSQKLHVSGKLNKMRNATLKLFASDVELETGDQFKLIVNDNGDLPSISLWEDVSDAGMPILVKPGIGSVKPLGNGFKEITYKIPKEYDGMDVKGFGVAYTNDKDSISKNIDSEISSISFTPVEKLSDSGSKNKIINFRNDGDFLDFGKRNTRISWDTEYTNNVDRYIIYASDSSDDFSKDKVYSVTSLSSAFLTDLPKYKDINLTIDGYDKNNNLVINQKAVLKTSFESMANKNKWNVRYSDVADANSKWLENSDHGFTTSLVDEEGNIYYADDYSRIFKIDSNGVVRNSKNSSFGKSLDLIDEKDVSVRKIINYNSSDILAMTSRGQLFLINKKSGEKEDDFPQDMLRNLWGDSLDKEEKNIITDVSFAENTSENKVSLILKRKSGISANKTETNLININDKVVTSECLDVPIDFIGKDGDKIDLIFRKNDQIMFDQVDKIGDIPRGVTSLNNLASSIKSLLVAGYGSDPSWRTNDSLTTSTDIESLVDGKWIFSKKIGDNILMLNEFGVLVKMDATSKTVKKVTEILTPDELQAFCVSMDDLMDAAKGHAGFNIPDHKIKTMISLAKRYNWDLISKDAIVWDDLNKEIILLKSKELQYKWWGFASSNKIFSKIKLTDFLSNDNKNYKLPLQVNKELPSSSVKSIDEIRFIVKSNNSYIVGGSTGKVAILDKDLNIIPFGKKVYSYDGRDIAELSFVFDDKNREIPPILMS